MSAPTTPSDLAPSDRAPSDLASSEPAPSTSADQADLLADALADRLFTAMIDGMELLTVHVGRETGLYEALLDLDGATATDLARATDQDHRSVDEWLRQQAAAGLVAVDDPAAPRDRRHYTLPAHAAEVILDPTSLRHIGPAGGFLVGIGGAMDGLVDSFRSGRGVPYADYGSVLRRAIADFNRPMFDNELGSTWLPAAPGLHAGLRQATAPRILDVGCGLGASTIALARTYPHALVWGLDLDEASVAEARAAAANAGLADRIRFVHGDALSFDPGARFDLVTLFESLHDTADPVAALANLRRLLSEGGHVMVADEGAAESFTAPADHLDRMLHAFSVLHCLPASAAEGSGYVHGPVVRPEDALGWFRDAGFDDPQVLDIDNDMWRFYLAQG